MPKFQVQTKSGKRYQLDLGSADELDAAIDDLEATEASAAAPKAEEPGMLSRIGGAVSDYLGGKLGWQQEEVSRKRTEYARNSAAGLTPLDMPHAPDSSRDPMVSPEFEAKFRDEVIGTLPVEKRMDALKAMTTAPGVYGRAARNVLRTAESENAASRQFEITNPGQAELAATPSAPAKAGGKRGAPPAVPVPEVLDLGLPMEDGQRRQIEAKASASNAMARDKSMAPPAEEVLMGKAVSQISKEAGERAERMLGWMPDQLRDTTLSVAKALPMTIQFAAEMVGSRDVREWAKAVNTGADAGKSAEEQAKDRELKSILADPKAGALEVVGFLMANPDYLARQAVESGGSMIPIVGVARTGVMATNAASRMALRGRTLTEGAAKEMAAIAEKAAERGAVLGESWQGAASTYHQLLDKGADPSDAAMGAFATGAGYLGIGKFTGGGAEAVLAGAKQPSRARLALKEGAQEYAQQYADDTGQAVGSGQAMDWQSTNKQGLVAGAAGAVMGGALGAGKSAEQLIAESINDGNFRPLTDQQGARIFQAATSGNASDSVVQHGQALELARHQLMEDIDPAKQPTTPLTTQEILAKVQQVRGNPGSIPNLKAAQEQREDQERQGAKNPQGVDPNPIVGSAAIQQGSLAERARAAVAPAEQQTPAKPSDPDWQNFPPETGTLGIPRAEMPQIKAEHRGPLVNFLQARGITHEQAEVPAGDLKPTQAEFSISKVDKAREFQGGDRSILVSADGYILDGHHQWLAKTPENQSVKVIRLSAPMSELLPAAREFPSSTLDAASEQPTYRSKDEAIVAAAEGRMGAVTPVKLESGRWALRPTKGEVQRTVPLQAMSSAMLASPEEDQAAVDDLNRALGVSTESMSRSSRSGGGPGVVTVTKAVSPVWEAVRQAAAAMGVHAVAVDGLTGGDGVAWQNRNGRTVAYVGQRKGFEFLVGIAGHEGLHAIATENPELYGRYASQIQALLRPGAVKNRLAYERQWEPDTTAERAKEEVLADISGASWLREDFWRKVDELDGDLFRRLRYRFMANMVKMLDGLRLSKAFTKGDRFALEKLVTDVDKAVQLTAELWAEKAKAGRSTQVSPREKAIDKAMEEALAAWGVRHSRGVLAEVAPNPDKPEAKDWRQLDAPARQQVTDRVAKRLISGLERVTKLRLTLEPAKGSYEGEKNPAMVIRAEGASDQDLTQLARVVGYVLDQKAMVVFDEGDTSSGDQATFVKVVLPAGMSTSQVESLRDHIMQVAPALGGDHTVRDGAIAYGNFTGFGDNPMSDDAFHDAIDQAVASFQWDGEAIRTRRLRFRSELIWPESRDGYLEGTFYGEGNPGASTARRDDFWRGQWGGDVGVLRSVADDIIRTRDGWVDTQLRAAGVSRVAAVPAEGVGQLNSAAGPVGDVQASYGKPRDGAVSVTGYHYSKGRQSVLIGAMHGSGLKGAERERLSGADPRLKNRIYFYVPNANGVQPEAGVGGYLHGVKLNNLYDVASDPLGLVKQGGGANAFEARVLDAGFDGYYASMAMPTPQAILLGPRSVKVDYLGQHGKLKYSRDEDKKFDEGAFARQPDLSGYDIEKVTDEDYGVTKKDELNFQAELDAEMGRAVSRPEGQEIQAKPDDIRKAGMFMESAFPDLEYKEEPGGRLVATVQGPNRKMVFTLKQAGAGMWSATPTQNDNDKGGGAMSLREVSEDLARSYLKRVAASYWLQEEGYDLARQVDRKAATRVVTTWKKLAKLDGAFEFRAEPAEAITPAGGRFWSPASVQRAQEIADSVLEGAKFQFQVRAADTGFLEFVPVIDGEPRPRDENGIPQTAQMEPFDKKTAVLHSIDLKKGSGWGKAFYQAAALIAKDRKMTIRSDANLTAINSYRRTEQQLSATLRSMDASIMSPGDAQRIYGWQSGKGATADNLLRLLIAGARNAKEIAPWADQLRYDIPTQTFTIDGQNADEQVAEFLATPDARATGMSKATLARAALTFEAMQGPVEVPASMPRPLLYSRGESDERSTPLDNLRADAYKAVRGREVRVGDSTVDAGSRLAELGKAVGEMRLASLCI